MKMEDELLRTAWIHPATPPVHIGAYETLPNLAALSPAFDRFNTAEVMWWDGGRWRELEMHGEEMVVGRTSKTQKRPWRGLAARVETEARVPAVLSIDLMSEATDLFHILSFAYLSAAEGSEVKAAAGRFLMKWKEEIGEGN